MIIEEDIIFRAVDVFEYNGETYIYGFLAPESIEEAIDPSGFERAFLKEVIEEETQELFVEEIEDEKLIQELKQEVIKKNNLKIEKD